MNQVVAFNPQQPQVATAPSFTMSDMERVALAIAKGGLFGSTDPNAVLTLCMLAQAEGQHPAVVFRDYHIIQGKPAKKAEAMHRDFLAAGGKIEWHRCDDECADATFSHPQGGSMRVTWDDRRVAQAQLGGNPMHKKYPRQMKRSRVISEGVRSVFPMATSGLYETGEVQDIVQDDRPTPPTPEAKRARDIEGKSTGRTKAEDWVRDQLASVASAADMEALDVVMAGGHKAVAKLAREHADLHATIQSAYETRTHELQGEGRDDTDMGEGFTDDTDDDGQSLTDERLTTFRTQIAAAANERGLKAVEGEWVNARAAYDDATAAEVEAMIAERRKGWVK